MFASMTLEDVSVLFGVMPATVPALGIAPTNGGRPPTLSGRFRDDWRISRRDFAKYLNVHPDTLTRKLAEGLAAAVIEPGQHSKEMFFDFRLAWRWWLAHTGRLNELVLADFRTCATAGMVAVSQLSALPLLFVPRHRRAPAVAPRRKRAAAPPRKEI